ncbi:MAG TPA: methyltransferase domain-containing protein [Gemmata sp.]|jgi:2-polyprenyl-3-methyl-5-hydroxy-6-metoxy-1,4-benzoquinol methylase|nr:methyltransferase domain-containing protein [Gemmata sp.]
MAFLSGLQNRERIPELMDDPALDPVEHRYALEGLARINRFSGSIAFLWPTIRNLARKLKRPVRVLDVATGSGDVPAGLLAKAARAGLELEVAGCDISATAIASAKASCQGIWFFVHDAIREPLPAGFDVVTCSLFLHHLSGEDAVLLLGRMKEATNRFVLVNDLARSRFNFLSVSMACRVLTRSRVVRFDGPASVRSAFTPAEALALAERAGLTQATIRTRFPCRFLLSWCRGSC